MKNARLSIRKVQPFRNARGATRRDEAVDELLTTVKEIEKSSPVEKAARNSLDNAYKIAGILGAISMAAIAVQANSILSRQAEISQNQEKIMEKQSAPIFSVQRVLENINGKEGNFDGEFVYINNLGQPAVISSIESYVYFSGSYSDDTHVMHFLRIPISKYYTVQPTAENNSNHIYYVLSSGRNFELASHLAEQINSMELHGKKVVLGIDRRVYIQYRDGRDVELSDIFVANTVFGARLPYANRMGVAMSFAQSPQFNLEKNTIEDLKIFVEQAIDEDSKGTAQ